MSTAPTLDVARPERPVIDTADAELHALADQGWAAILNANDPPRIFRRGTRLVRVADGPDGRKVVEEQTKESLSALLSRVARWRRIGADGKVRVVHPPERVAKIILDGPADEYPGAPRLDRIAHAPFFAAPAGTTVWDMDDAGNPTHQVQLVTEPGYYPDLHVFYDPDPELRHLHVTGSDSDTADAIAVINRVLHDFPFIGEGSRAHAVSLLLLPFVRELIDGDTPLYLITAPTPGTGKGLLTDTLLIPASKVIPRSTVATAEDEWRKRITSELLEAPSVILFDNVASEPGLNSPTMAAVLTAGGWWKDRKLGVSQVVTLPVRNVWVATGNNVKVSDENARRVARIHLDRGVEDPSALTGFAIPNLHQWVGTHRAELVWAALTIVQNWLRGHTVEGSVYTPWLRHGTKLKQSYIEWSRVLGGLLQHIGIDGFGVQDDLGDATERDELAFFFETWQREAPQPLTVRDLAHKIAAFQSELGEALPAKLLGLRSEQLEAKLPSWLRDHRNRVSDGRQLIRIDGRPPRWTITAVASA